jgi:hypothetical protein
LSQRSTVKGQNSTVSRFFTLSVFATKTITEKPKGKGGQNDQIGGQDHRIRQSKLRFFVFVVSGCALGYFLFSEGGGDFF